MVPNSCLNSEQSVSPVAPVRTNASAVTQSPSHDDEGAFGLAFELLSDIPHRSPRLLICQSPSIAKKLTASVFVTEEQTRAPKLARDE